MSCIYCTPNKHGRQRALHVNVYRQHIGFENAEKTIQDYLNIKRKGKQRKAHLANTHIEKTKHKISNEESTEKETTWGMPIQYCPVCGEKL